MVRKSLKFHHHFPPLNSMATEKLFGKIEILDSFLNFIRFSSDILPRFGAVKLRWGCALVGRRGQDQQKQPVHCGQHSKRGFKLLFKVI